MNKFLRFARKAALGAAAGVLLSGCFENDFLTTYQGPDQVAFAQVSGRYTLAVGERAGTVNLTVELISSTGTLANDLTVDVLVDAAGTSAVDGVHYRFPNGRQVTIPAGKATGTLPIEVIDGPLAGATATAAAQRVTLDMELSDSADGSVTGAENWDDFTLTIVGQAPAASSQVAD